MDCKQFAVPFESGRDEEGFLEMVDRLLSLPLGMVNLTKDLARLTKEEFLAFVREETNRL